MDEDMMGMDVAPVMDPQQMGAMPQQDMMQGTPDPGGMPQEIQNELDSIDGADKEEAKQALMQITKIIEQMIADGATDEQIAQFLQQVGITMEELEITQQMFGM